MWKHSRALIILVPMQALHMSFIGCYKWLSLVPMQALHMSLTATNGLALSPCRLCTLSLAATNGLALSHAGSAHVIGCYKWLSLVPMQALHMSIAATNGLALSPCRLCTCHCFALFITCLNTCSCVLK